MTRLNKLYFLFHPVCWATALDGDEPPPGADRAHFLACLDWERQANAAQKAFISRLAADAALVIFPIGDKPVMREIEAHALNALGDRCIIARRAATAVPAAWAALSNPIARFLDGELEGDSKSGGSLEGKAGFLRGVPPEVHRELCAELHEACRIHGYGWNPAALKVAYFSRQAADDIRGELAQRGLHYDARTVESEAFGEGFEQCAMTWKAMLVPYLGLAKPALNNAELSVSGAPLLLNARFRERVMLDHEVQLFLWESATGSPIALYARAWCRLRDPQYYATVSLASDALNSNALEFWNLTQRCSLPPGQFGPAGQSWQIPVLNAMRRDATDEPFYLTSHYLPFAQFRARLTNAAIHPGHRAELEVPFRARS